MEKKIAEVIKKITKELLKKMGFDVEVEIKENISEQGAVEKEGRENNLVCNISVSDNSNFIIGQHGINLQALQHIIRLVVRKETEERVNFMVDVNSYRQQKSQAIIEQANSIAKQAINEKKAVVMRPMSAYERRIVHMELAENDKVVTESIGEGEGRKIVIKPVKII
ncbi:R3H domain protein [bacterium BMS3Abin15]|nr:R3H domain protein [bacterium BMS3Abin15]HDZ85619.1 hypothetical protein [Candidatus Moranbacteria bacterium]